MAESAAQGELPGADGHPEPLDAAHSGILDVIVESTATKIFLPNVYARDEDTAALYRRMGLNARQIEILATAVPKRHYYYVSEHGRRLYTIWRLDPWRLPWSAFRTRIRWPRSSASRPNRVLLGCGNGWRSEGSTSMTIGRPSHELGGHAQGLGDEKKPAQDSNPRRAHAPLRGGRRPGESENPYLAARRTWNEHVGAVVAARQTWQVVGVLSL